MPNASSPFLRMLLANLRLSGLILAAGIAGAGLFALVAGEPVAWELVAFLGVGMLLSSLGNAYYDARRERGEARR